MAPSEEGDQITMATNLATVPKASAGSAALSTTLSHLPVLGSSPVAGAGTRLVAVGFCAAADRMAERAGKTAPSKLLAPAGLAIGLLGGPRYRALAETMIVGAGARYAVEAGQRAGDAMADVAGLPPIAPKGGEAVPVSE